jgi:hypothetical protein
VPAHDHRHALFRKTGTGVRPDRSSLRLNENSRMPARLNKISLVFSIFIFWQPEIGSAYAIVSGTQ